MDPSDVDLTQVIQGPEDTEDQNADNNIHAVLKVEVDVSPPKFLTFTLKAERTESLQVDLSNSQQQLREQAVKLEELQLQLISAQHAEKRLQQERELVQSQVSELREEVVSYRQEAAQLRRDKTGLAVDLQSQLDEQKEHARSLSSPLETWRSTAREQEQRAEALAQRLRDAQESHATLESHFHHELQAQAKLTEMHKEAPKRGKRKAALAEDVALGTPPKVTAEPAERDVLSPPSAKMALRRKPKILFTGMECTNEEEIVKRLGGAIATTASTCTHLVTDKFLRTVKSLCCIGKGTPIVDVAWIKKCQEAKTFVEHTPYLLKDTEAEKSLKFVLDETLRQASSSGGVLQGWSIHATGRVLPSPADLKEIVSCAGGKYLAKMPTRATGGSTVIVSCKEDLKACTQAKKNGVPVVSVEFVLSGLLQYKLDVNAHSLN